MIGIYVISNAIFEKEISWYKGNTSYNTIKSINKVKLFKFIVFLFKVLLISDILFSLLILKGIYPSFSNLYFGMLVFMYIYLFVLMFGLNQLNQFSKRNIDKFYKTIFIFIIFVTVIINYFILKYLRLKIFIHILFYVSMYIIILLFIYGIFNILCLDIYESIKEKSEGISFYIFPIILLLLIIVPVFYFFVNFKAKQKKDFYLISDNQRYTEYVKEIQDNYDKAQKDNTEKIFEDKDIQQVVLLQTSDFYIISPGLIDNGKLFIYPKLQNKISKDNCNIVKCRFDSVEIKEKEEKFVFVK